MVSGPFPSSRPPGSPISAKVGKWTNLCKYRPRINFSPQIRFWTQKPTFPRGLHNHTKESPREAASAGGAAGGAGGGRAPPIAQPRAWARAGQPWGPFAPGVRHEAALRIRTSRARARARGCAFACACARARARARPRARSCARRSRARTRALATSCITQQHSARTPPLLSPQVGYLVL